MSPRQWTLLAWLLFTISGLFFLADAIETGDKTALGSALTWLLGVAFFLKALPAETESEPND